MGVCAFYSAFAAGHLPAATGLVTEGARDDYVGKSGEQSSHQRIKPRRKSARKLVHEQHFDGQSPFFQLENPDPDVMYVWANPGNAAHPGTVGYYQWLGYVVIESTDDQHGIRTRAGNSPAGKEIVRGDMVLMGIHKDDYALLVEEGPDGRKGQARARALLKQLGRGASPAAGNYIDPELFREVQNDSSELVKRTVVG